MSYSGNTGNTWYSDPVGMTINAIITALNGLTKRVASFENDMAKYAAGTNEVLTTLKESEVHLDRTVDRVSQRVDDLEEHYRFVLGWMADKEKEDGRYVG